MLSLIDADEFITSVGPYSHLLSECILLGKATSHMAPREDAEGRECDGICWIVKDNKVSCWIVRDNVVMTSIYDVEFGG